MALRRMVPTRFFKDPDIMSLSSRDTQLILVGLVLNADDEGRELAHAGLLGREMDYPAEQIEAALQELADNDLLVLYMVGRHRYYSLTQWQQWQTLGNKATPSKYPAPPEHAHDQHNTELPKETPQLPKETPDVPEEGRNFPDQFNVSKRSEFNEGEGDEREPSNVTPFPTTHTDGTTEKVLLEGEEVAKEVAQILKLSMSQSLMRVITDYLHTPLLSLLGEADAAREWIDDPQRNRHGKRMTPAFFRRWLRREQEEIQARQAHHQQLSTGTDGTAETHPATPRASPGSAVKNRSLMDLETQYKAAQQKGPH